MHHDSGIAKGLINVKVNDYFTMQINFLEIILTVIINMYIEGFAGIKKKKEK